MPSEPRAVATHGKDRRGRSDFSVVALAATALVAGGCGRSGWQNALGDAQGGHDAGKEDSRGAFPGDASGGNPDGGPGLGVTIGNNAIAVAACSPNDATAVTITIGVDRPSCDSAASGSYVVVKIWYTSWDNLKPGTYALDLDHGGAGLCSPAQGASSCEAGTNTVLTVKSIDSGRMTGHCQSAFPSGTVSVDFTAEWCAGDPMCL